MAKRSSLRKDSESPFPQAIPGTGTFAGMVKDTFGAFRTGLGIPESQTTAVCEGCGAPLTGRPREIVRCEYCNRETRL